jgi:dipeptidyl aminopeptidase/acylaminoacyl peptidase
MMTAFPLRRLALAALLCLNATHAAQAQAPAAPAASIPASAFFDNPAFSAPQLSPDGRSVALKVANKAGRIRLVVVDTASRKATVAAAFDDSDINRYQWVNDNRLVFNVTDMGEAQGDVRFAPGLWAVNRDGGDLRQLVRRDSDYNDGLSKFQSKLLPWHTLLLPTAGPQDSDDVLVTQYEFGATHELANVALLRLNTVTGKYKTFARPADTMGWIADRHGVPRIAETVRDNQVVYYTHDSEDQPWRQLASFQQYPPQAGSWEPVWYAPDGTLYVRASHGGERALFRYDAASGKPADKPVIGTPGYDFNGAMEFDQNKVLGFTYEIDAKGTYWVDERMKAVQAAVDALLPATNNMITVPLRAATPFVLVVSNSDLQPAVYRLYNTETRSLSMLGSSHPSIAPERMAPKTMVRYKARDGLEIPAYVTIPRINGGKNLPMVVLVHGGPWVRGGHWDWEAQSQFLASRGYVVLEADYRGSTGYGNHLFEAGWKQWGLKMQDDLADGARWAIAQGIADPKRICIAGASYGGYATLMGLVNDPDLFKCGVDWAGVTDIALLQKGHWSGDSDLDEVYKKIGMPLLVGDAVKDAAQLKATSPLAQAARIKQPLLLAYGGADQRVPIIHGSAFYDAVKQTNPNVDYVLYNEEGHGWFLPKNRVDFWTRVEQFLNKNIGKP